MAGEIRSDLDPGRPSYNRNPIGEVVMSEA
jgi:hypothetical protein